MITQLVVYQIIHISKLIWKLITIDFSKQQAVNADPKEIKQINLAENLDQAGNKTMVFILE